MGAEQKKEEDHKDSFCLVAKTMYNEQYHGEEEEEEEEDDLEMIKEEEDEDEASSSSSFEGSSRSRSSSSSLEIIDDATSSLSMSSQSNGALYDLSELMSNLPIKRGLSKFYQGKSQSFTSLARVTSLEDLVKKVSDNGGYSSRMKACKSYGAGFNFNTHHQRSSPHTAVSPKANIAKKSSSFSCLKGKTTTNRTCFISTKSSIRCVES